MECAERATSKQINLLTSFNHKNQTDLRFSCQYKNFDILHSFWGLMEAENRHLLVTVDSVIFQLAVGITEFIRGLDANIQRQLARHRSSDLE